MDNQGINGISYTLHGDYYTPDLVLPEKEYIIGKYGMLRKSFLQEHRKGTYSAMLLGGTLYDHLQEIDEQAHDSISRTVKEMAAREGVNEALKANDQMEWVRRMNGIKARAEEIVLHGLICG